MEIEIKLSKLHPAQETILSEAKRFNVLDCGRRWGKSELALNILCDAVLDGFPVGYFTPIYRLLEGTYNECLKILDPIITKKSDQQYIETKTGGRIDFWSMDNEMAGRSKKYKIAILDECAYTRNLWTVWTESIRATLADMEGSAWFLSTPKGKNDFYKLYMKGKQGDDGWQSWQMSTYTNPYINRGEIDDARKDLPAAAFSQEYLAEFLENSANPFGGNTLISQCTYPLSLLSPVVYGIDLGKAIDFTVIIGLDKHGAVCLFNRFKQDWRQTIQDILALPKATIVLDATGLGDPIGEEIASVRNTVLFKFSPLSKQQIMEGLALAIHQRKISFPEGIIVEELNNFEYQYTRGGVKYSAPTGLHDDCVCALALAWHKWKEEADTGNYSVW